MNSVFSRVAAALTIVGAGAHVLLAVLYLGESFFAAVLLGAMAGWCLHCGLHLWRDGTPQVWRRAALGGVGMIGLHVAMMTTGPAGSVGGHQHSNATGHTPMVALDGLMTTAMAAGIVAEAVLILGVLVIASTATSLADSEPHIPDQVCEVGNPSATLQRDAEITTVKALSRIGAAEARTQPGQRPRPA